MFIWFYPKDFDSEDSLSLLVGLDDIIATPEGGYQFSFDGVEQNAFYNFLSSREKISEQESYPDPFIISGVFNNDFKKWHDKYQSIKTWSRWFQMVLTKKETPQRMEVFQDTSENPEGEIWYLLSLNGITQDDSDAVRLNQTYSLENFEPSNPALLEKALSTYNRTTTHYTERIKFNLYNVGQGNMSAITTENNVPIIYYDLGGGFFWNAHTYPVAKNLCWTIASTIILSHWDLDHLETARRLLHRDPNQLNGKTWIAPIQNITPYYHRIASQIAARGTLLLWGNIPRISFWGGEIVKCSGPDKNHSGLSLIVNLNGEKILHPADAAYTFIPGVLNEQFGGMVATHHGAEFPTNNHPVPAPLPNNPNIAFSYGLNNSYDHPREPSVDAHYTNGWINRLDTINGSISFQSIGSNTTNATPCPGNTCDLSVNQSF